MLAIPAIEVGNGPAVRSGEAPPDRDPLGDPRDIARRWNGLGFTRLHVVDVDAMAGRGSNHEAIRTLLADGVAPMQVDCGARSTDGVEDLLRDGAHWVIVGGRATEDLRSLTELADASPGSVILAVEVRNRRVVTPGGGHPRHLLDLIDELSGVPLGGLLVGAAHRAEKAPAEPADLPLLEDLAESCQWPVMASRLTGLVTMADLRALEDRGVAAVVLGTVMRSGALDPETVAAEFAA